MNLDMSDLDINWEMFNVKTGKTYDDNKKIFLDITIRAKKLLNMELHSLYRGETIPITIKNEKLSITATPHSIIKKLDEYESFKNLIHKEGDKLLDIKGIAYRNGFIARIILWDGRTDEVFEFTKHDYIKFIERRRTFYKELNIDINKLRTKYPINWNKLKVNRGARYEDAKRTFLSLVIEAWDLFKLELTSDYSKSTIDIEMKNKKFCIIATQVSLLKKFDSHKKFLKILEQEGDRVADIIGLSEKNEFIYRIITFDTKNNDNIAMTAGAYYKFIIGRKKFYNVLNSNNHYVMTNYKGSEKNIEIDYGCHHKNEITLARNYIKSPRCKFCNNYGNIIKVSVGENDIATTHPHLVKYFYKKEDSQKYSFGSDKTVDFICPDCKTKQPKKVSSIINLGLNCKRCGDSISFPQKIMNNVLFQLVENNILSSFETEYNPEWACGPYDNKFEIDGEIYIIENHGKQHYEESTRGRSLREEQQNDDNKYNIAVKNGVLHENYIIVDARNSELEYIKRSIINSRLSEIFDLNIIDWDDCFEKSLKNLVKVVCDLYTNENISVPKISARLKIGKTTVRRYLRKGELLGWCIYDTKKEQMYVQKNASECRKTKVVCLNTKKTFNSIKEAAEFYNINPSSISQVCRGKSYFGGRDKKNNIYYVWAKLEDFNKMNESDINNKLKKAYQIGINSSIKE